MSSVLKRVEIAYTVLGAVKRYTDKEVSIQGGFARDLHYKRLPKDADIFIHEGSTQSVDVDKLLFTIRKIVSSKFGPMSYTLMKAYGESTLDDFAERHHGVLQLVFLEHQFSVDVILTKPENTQESLKTFDCNLNQFFINEEGLPEHLSEIPDTLVFSDKPIRECRITKMKTLAKEVGVTVDA